MANFRSAQWRFFLVFTRLWKDDPLRSLRQILNLVLDFNKIGLAQGRFFGNRCLNAGGADGELVALPGAMSGLQERMVQVVAVRKDGDSEDEVLVMRLLVGASRHRHNDVSMEVLMWRCRLRLPNVLVFFLKYLMTARPFVVWLSLRERDIFREVNESVLALKFTETGGVGLSESCEKVRYSIFVFGDL